MTTQMSNFLYRHDIDKTLFPMYGAARRKFIMDWFAAHPTGILAINRKHTLQLRHDVDLQKLVKSKFLKQVRIGGFSGSGRWSYLTKA